MANEVHTGPEPTLTSLVTGIVTDVQELVKQQLNLFRQEVKDDVRKSKEAAITLGAGIGMLVVSAIFLCLMLVYLLHWAFPTVLQDWICYGIIGGLLFLGGAGLLYAGKRKLASFHPLPDQSVGALRENVRWITNPRR
jgi:uncharacterized membrane protein YqjE